MEAEIKEYSDRDLPELIKIWNEVVDGGVAFPQEERLDEKSGREFFAKQDFVGAAKCGDETVGLYILHPNNVGRCSHIANASYAVLSSKRGLKIGEKLVSHSLLKAGELGYKILMFNAVVKGNNSAIHIYEKLGFHKIGEVPSGYRLSDGTYRDINLYYHEIP